jgi:hypothetical protein
MLRQEWWNDVDFARTLVERVGSVPCPGRRCSAPDHVAMVAREAALIKELDPSCNRRLGNRCRSGRHLLTPENTYTQPGGGRTCKECRAERQASLSEEKRQQYARAREPSLAAWRREHQEQIRAQDREYRQQPEVKARAKAYKHSPEGRAKLAEQQREYRNRPEVRDRLNARQRERRQRPEPAARLKAYAEKPDVRARKREYQKRPEVQARRNELQRERYRAALTPARALTIARQPHATTHTSPMIT